MFQGEHLLSGLCHLVCRQYVESNSWIAPSYLRERFTNRNIDHWHWDIRRKGETTSISGVDKRLAISHTDSGQISKAFGSRPLEGDAYYWEIGHIYCGTDESYSLFGIITQKGQICEPSPTGTESLRSPPHNFFGIDTTGKIWEKGRPGKQNLATQAMDSWTVVGMLFDGSRKTLSIYINWSLIATLQILHETGDSIFPVSFSEGKTTLARLRALRWTPLSLKSMCLAEIRKKGGDDKWGLREGDLPPDLMSEVELPYCPCAPREYEPTEIMEGHVPIPKWGTQYCCKKY